MLRYWSPSIASHFFPACTDENRTDWLGPISCLQWQSTLATEWQTVDNPHANLWLHAAAKPLLALSIEQQQSLNLKSQFSNFNGQES